MSQSKSNRLFWRRFVSSEPAQVIMDIPPQSSPTYPTPWLPIPQNPDFRRGRGGAGHDRQDVTRDLSRPANSLEKVSQYPLAFSSNNSLEGLF
jgi:hypothetical protein